MVNKKDSEVVQDDVEITNDNPDMAEPELEDIEENTDQKIKSLRTKLTNAEQEARTLREEMQRAKADFLNAKRRLEEERKLDKERTVVAHIEKLLPLCDSFYLAMLDTEAWEKGDEKWRKGVEGINAQLQNVLTSYNVKPYNPQGEQFDPHRHEALSSVPTDTQAEHNTVKSVIQLGYERTVGDSTDVIRPARVTVAEHTAQ